MASDGKKGFTAYKHVLSAFNIIVFVKKRNNLQYHLKYNYFQFTNIYSSCGKIIELFVPQALVLCTVFLTKFKYLALFWTNKYNQKDTDLYNAR